MFIDIERESIDQVSFIELLAMTNLYYLYLTFSGSSLWMLREHIAIVAPGAMVVNHCTKLLKSERHTAVEA